MRDVEKIKNSIRSLKTMKMVLEGDDGFAAHVEYPGKKKTYILNIICSYGLGWEHVSVSCRQGMPTWSMMHAVKQMFWEPTEAVMQLHPPEKDYVNIHPNCLHLWRPTDQEIPLPPVEMV